MLGPEFNQIERTIPDDHSKMSSAEDLLAEVLDGREAPDVLDLGCGDGRGLDLIASLSPGARYTGVDIETSPEVDGRSREDARFLTFDGVNLPMEDASCDIVYSRQVFEHVRHPDQLVRDVCRVLRPGGHFVGSLSNLEPYHSFSIFNYTPYGVFRLVEDNGMTLKVMRPGVEGTSLVVRQLTVRKISGLRIVYPMVELAGRLRKWGPRRRNYLKLRFSGHICFVASKDG